MGKSAPSPPDPYATAAAQTTSNVATATANQELNDINSTNPFYSTTYTRNGTNPDGTPILSQSINATPQEQTLINQSLNQGIQKNDLANQYIDGSFTNMANEPLNTSNVGALTTNVTPGVVPASISPAGPVQTGFSLGAPAQGQINTSGVQPINPFGLGAAQAQMDANAVYNAEQPYMNVQQQDLNNSLVNEGVQQGTQAWDNAQMPLEQQENQLYNTAVQTGLGEQQSLYGLGLQTNNQEFNQAATEGEFANQAQAQQYGENLGEAQFGNAAQQQQFGQNAAEAQFGAQTQAQAFAQGQQNAALANAASGQNLSQDITAIDQPINEYNALATGSTLSPPGYSQPAPIGMQGTDLMGAINNAYNAQVGTYNSQMGGLYGLGGAGLMALALG